MTEKELLEKYNITLHEFSPSDWSRNGFYDSLNRVIYINAGLSPEERKKVLLHEIGHLQHLPSGYRISKTRCENEANRNMIHHLLVDALSKSENIKEFNYLKFMEYYNLKTITDEIMVKEEYCGLVKGE